MPSIRTGGFVNDSVKSLLSIDKGAITYKILHSLCPNNLRNKFFKRSKIPEYEIRDCRDLKIPKVKLEYAK